MNKITYLSTRGLEKKLNFEDVLLSGLARDGGLYLPSEWPKFTLNELNEMKHLDYISLAERIIKPYVGDDVACEVFSICKKIYQKFENTKVAPLIQIDDNIHVVELFHGPTLAFKDYAMQFLSEIFEKVLQKKNKKILIVGATSGDTGSAALEAFKDKVNINLFILFPNKKVSIIQQKQMTTIFDKGCQSVAVNSDFDGCQSIVKTLFKDLKFKDEFSLSAINSINWVRLIPQVVYYFFSAFMVGAPQKKISFSVPTGNFGNIFSGWIAKQMGLPINKLICGSNKNDILDRFFKTGVMERKNVEPSYSPSMDIQVSSNFERLLFELFDRDDVKLKNLMTQFETNKKYDIGNSSLQKINHLFFSHRVTDEEILSEIKHTFDNSKYLIDPHTAVGVKAAREALSSGKIDNVSPIVSLACAHPAKFPDIIKKSLKFKPQNPSRLEKILDKEEHFKILDVDISKIKSHIISNMRI